MKPIHVKSFTWQRDSHGLYDYESSSVVQQNFTVNEGKFIMRQAAEIILSNEIFDNIGEALIGQLQLT